MWCHRYSLLSQRHTEHSLPAFMHLSILCPTTPHTRADDRWLYSRAFDYFLEDGNVIHMLYVPSYLSPTAMGVDYRVCLIYRDNCILTSISHFRPQWGINIDIGTLVVSVTCFSIYQAISPSAVHQGALGPLAFDKESDEAIHEYM